MQNRSGFPAFNCSFFFLIIVFFLLPVQSSAQEKKVKATLSGRITDAIGKLPLENVDLFFDNTTIGDVSDKDGRYEIKNIPPGRYTLIVSLIGYKVEKVPLEVVTSKKLVRNFQLQIKIFQFQPLEVTAEKAKGWKKNLKRFVKLFIGTSQFAGQCEIINPEVLDFSNVSGSFLAAADTPLEIDNRALGYRIRFILDGFKVANNELSYYGQTRFKKKTPRDEKERLQWQKNRQTAYMGSMRHFLASVLKGRSKMEGFIVSRLVESQKEKREKAPGMIVKTPITIKKGALPLERVLSFSGRLQVEYTHERAEAGYLDGREQLSWIELTGSSVIADTGGNLLYRNAIKRFGYWAWKRIGDMLPMDFVPEPSIYFTPAVDSLEMLIRPEGYNKIHSELVVSALDELAFNNSDHAALIKQLHRDIVDIMNKPEINNWLKLKTNRQKAEFLRRFWLFRDRSFDTRKNERLDEHYQRLHIAKTNYAAVTPAGYDDRGRIYIKYGAPEGKVADVVSENGRSTETWVYTINGKQITFDFVDKVYGYALMYQPDESLIRFSNPIVQFAAVGTMLRKRQSISLTYFNAYNYYLELEREQDNNSGTYESKLIAYKQMLLHMNQHLNELAANNAAEQAKLPTIVSKQFENISELSYSFKPALFEDAADSYTLAFVYGIRINDVKLSVSGSENRPEIQFGTIIRNPGLANMVTDRNKIPLQTTSFNGNSELIYQNRFSLPVKNFYILSDVNNPAGKQRGFKDYVIKIPRYSQEKLHLSSVIFAEDIVPSASVAKAKKAAFLIRNDLAVKMNPFSELAAGEPVFLYFEIYGLHRDPSGKTKYNIEYTVNPVGKKGFGKFLAGLNPFGKGRGKISISYTQEGQEINDYFSIRLDFGRLKPGKYEMIVRVKDDNANDAKETKTSFVLK
ncbi:MAG TPA: GWxTD domain-containing protein [Bacteroidetes bacterium]|nr:GWxTD domain-containing protein [Bacteroidota bacterium]